MTIPLEKITVSGLTEDENEAANRLLAKIQAKLRRNLLRASYYDAKRAARQIATTLPPQYNSLGIALGWTGKAVDLLVRRCRLDGFTWDAGDLDSLGWRTVWDENMLASEVKQGAKASAISSTAFIVTTRGTVGEPDVLWQFFPATKASGDWNSRARRLDSLVTLTDYDEQGKLSEFVLYLPNLTITCSRASGSWVVAERQEHVWGVPAEPMPFTPDLGRPFGRSRITRPMMAIQDQAVRELLRLEGHMDIYSFPEFWMLGADPSIFTNADSLVQTSWETMLGRIKGIPDDPNPADPSTARADVKKFDASSPEPHLAALNAFAKLFAREASLPDTSLAITDFANPTSADAYEASQDDLIADAEESTDGWSPYLRRSMLRSLGMLNGLDGWDSIPTEWLSIEPRWRSAKFVSRSAEADAGAKQLASVPWLAETQVGLELLGLTDPQIRSALAQREQAQARGLLSELARLDAPATGAVSAPGDGN